jgi:hypothetical protein
MLVSQSLLLLNAAAAAELGPSGGARRWCTNDARKTEAMRGR